MATSERPYRGRSAPSRRADRRKKLLEAGLDLLASRGWRGATMTAICANANLTERYFYESFRNRDELLVTVIDGIADEIRTVTLAAMEAADGDPREQIRAGIAAFINLIATDPRKGRAAIIESAAAEPLRTRRRELLHDFARLIAAQSRKLYGEEALPPTRAHINGVLLAGGLAELVTAWLNGEMRANPEDIAVTVTSFFANTTKR